MFESRIREGNMLRAYVKKLFVVDSLMNLLSDSEINKQIFRGYALYYLSHFDNQHTQINGSAGTGLYPYLLKSTGKCYNF